MLGKFDFDQALKFLHILYPFCHRVRVNTHFWCTCDVHAGKIWFWPSPRIFAFFVLFQNIIYLHYNHWYFKILILFQFFSLFPGFFHTVFRIAFPIEIYRTYCINLDWRNDLHILLHKPKHYYALKPLSSSPRVCDVKWSIYITISTLDHVCPAILSVNLSWHIFLQLHRKMSQTKRLGMC